MSTLFGIRDNQMLKHTSITTNRIDQFLKHRLESKLIRDKAPLEVFTSEAQHADELAARRDAKWVRVEPGFKWGPAYQTRWFKVTGTIPKEWDGEEVNFVAEVGGERTWWMDNVPERGIDEPHSVCRIAEHAKGGESVDFVIQAYCMADVRVWGEVPDPKPEITEFKEAFLCRTDPAFTALYYDFLFAQGLMVALAETDPAQATLMRALNDICNVFEDSNKSSWSKARKAIKEALGSLPGELKHSVTAVGHAHLDTAWLWPLATTHLKMAHTTANQLYLMKRYSDYVFSHSQASQYEWVEKESPALFQRIQDAVKKGQWELVGSMWVEADCNLTGAESMVRQFLYGRRYFKQKFGVETQDMWLPDVFGYAAALPQILSKFGIKYFLTQKISWNQFNKFPHNTFWWKGIDGSRIWSHFPPADTYIGDCTPGQIIESVKKHKDHGRSDQSMYLFGWGDGGGGPTEKHVELLRRARTSPMLPVIETKKRAVDFFADAHAKSKDLVTWSGELYLEYHRGTYTSQAANKKGNRVSEFLLRDAELLASFSPSGMGNYPATELERLWKIVLLNQFHDIIPGSSVREVYEDSDKDYAEVIAGGENIIDRALADFGKDLDSRDLEQPVVLFQNATLQGQGQIPWDSDEVPQSIAVAGERWPVQAVDAFGERQIIFPVPPEALSRVAVADLRSETPSIRYRLKTGTRKIENGEYAVRFDPNGNITSITTLEDRPIEFIEPGKLANLFQLLDDRPMFWDAWDVDVFAHESVRDLVKCESFEIVERGPVRVAVEIVRRFGESTIKQRISLGVTPGIRFDTEVDWRESHKMLKVAFPLDLNASRATYEVQFGHVERPTHQNTSWDLARFEVCAQKWIDVSEGGHGVALLNDCKYGHDVIGNVMRLSLLRSPKAPDPICDMGVHRFSYTLLPHYDGILHSDVIAASYAFNSPLRAKLIKPGKGAESSHRLATVDTRHVIVETVKKAEDSDDLIVRLYECHNTRGNAELAVGRGVKRAWLTDLNEMPIRELEVADGHVQFEYKPFEIITILVRR